MLSVVVTIIDSGETLARCLTALRSQERAPHLEIIVPYDDSVAGLDALPDAFPGVRFLSISHVVTRSPQTSFAGQHELYDRRRAAGLAAASGEIVAILEDRGVPSKDWAATVVALHAEFPHGAIGGAIDNGLSATLNWAVYFCDFGRYQRPFGEGPSPFASDVNISYKRNALEGIRPIWIESYHEPAVHAALIAAGSGIFLTDRLVVYQYRDRLRIGALCAERVGWGRHFARLRELSTPTRTAIVLGSPLLPALITFRMVRDRLAKPHSIAPFLKALPVLVLLIGSWVLGETSGYLRARPTRDGRPTPA